MAWSKTYTIDYGATGDTVKEGIEKNDGNIEDIITYLNLLRKTHLGTDAPSLPDVGTIWLDSNYTPPRLKQYNGTSWSLVAHAGFTAPRGFLINGKISVTVDSNNLTVAIKTLADADPSTTDPVYCRIGDTVRTITAALSVTKNAGTNWFAACAAPIGGMGASGAQDYFVYLGYNATDGVVIGFARFPTGTRYDSFSSSSTNLKYCAISTIDNADAADVYENIGRFAATLGQSTNYYWSVSAFTAETLIQRPIYNTRKLAWAAVVSSSAGSLTLASVAIAYVIQNNTVYYDVKTTILTNGTGSGTISVTKLPFGVNTGLDYVSFSGARTAPTFTTLAAVVGSNGVLALVKYNSDYPGADLAEMYISGSLLY